MMRGLISRTTSSPKPSLSMTPGAKFSAKTSAFSISPRRMARPLSVFRLAVTLFLLALSSMKYWESTPFLSVDAPRPCSPLVGSSTLMTSAPSHPKVRVQDVPASNWVRSTTRTPLSAPRWAAVVPPMASGVRSSGIRFLLVVINHRRSRRRWRQSTLSLLLGVVNAFTLVVFSYAKWRSATSESAVDPEDDQRHIERKRKGEKRNGVKERLIADCDRRLRDLVDRHGNPEQLVVTIAGRDLNHPADVVPAYDIVDKIPRTAALPVGREHPGGNWILQLGQPRQPRRGLIAMLEKRGDSGLVRICHDPPRAGEYKAEASRGDALLT